MYMNMSMLTFILICLYNIFKRNNWIFKSKSKATYFKVYNVSRSKKQDNQ